MESDQSERMVQLLSSIIIAVGANGAAIWSRGSRPAMGPPKNQKGVQVWTGTRLIELESHELIGLRGRGRGEQRNRRDAQHGAEDGGLQHCDDFHTRQSKQSRRWDGPADIPPLADCLGAASVGN